MGSTLFCSFSLYDETNPEHLHFLHDPALGGNSKKCVRVDAEGKRDATLLLYIPPLQRGHPKNTSYSITKLTTLPALTPDIRTEETVFVKWSMDKQRVAALRHEAGFYAMELRKLQGSVVPRLIGCYESVNKDEHFSLSIFEYCASGVPSDNAEYHRQYMAAACAIHSVGVVHGQLALGYEKGASIDRHVLFDHYNRACIVDFTRAKRHNCAGASLQVPGAVETGECCGELSYLETVIGNRLTGLSARDAWRRKRDARREAVANAQSVKHNALSLLKCFKK